MSLLSTSFTLQSSFTVPTRRRSLFPWSPFSDPRYRRYSSTRISPYNGTFSGRYPRWARAFRDSLNTSWFAMEANPDVAGKKLDNIRIVVLLPAPFGPKKPTISPFATSKLRLLIAVTPAYFFVSRSTLIMKDVILFAWVEPKIV